jgi:protease-4
VAPPKKSRAGLFFFGALTGCLGMFAVLFLFGILWAVMRDDTGELSIGGNKIAILPIEGEIVESREAIEALHRYEQNHNVKGIVVRINSPGGAIAPSQEIYNEIRRARERSGKPIVASFDSVAASGGYYIAVGCEQIVANPGSITGSIGVILQWMEMKELIAWAKLKPETITSGPLKAAGSPYKELSDAERAYLQRIVLQLHGQFVAAVAQGRQGKLTKEQVAALADGRVFTGEEALGLKLVDSLGSLDDAVRVTAKLAGMTGDPDTIYPRKHDASLLELLGDAGDASTLLERVASRRVPQFLYRW